MLLNSTKRVRPAGSLTVSVESGREGLENAWRHLETEAKPSFFVSWNWIGTLIAALPEDCRPLVLRVFDGSETVALALIFLQPTRRHGLIRVRQLCFNAPGKPEYDCLTIEDNLLLARSAMESASWDALLSWFARQQRLGDEFILPGLREPLAQELTARHGLLRSEVVVTAHHVELTRLAAVGGECAALLTANARYQLRRAMRDYGGGSHLALAEARSPEEALDWFGAMRTLHIASWTRRGKPHSFTRPFFGVFHELLIRRAFTAGQIQMLRITANDEPIGYLYNFRDGARIYAYQSGFADADARRRPGFVSHALAIEHSFRNGARTYDFMAGTNRLKTTFATQTRSMTWTTLQVPLAKYRTEHLARRAKHFISGGT